MLRCNYDGDEESNFNLRLTHPNIFVNVQWYLCSYLYFNNKIRSPLFVHYLKQILILFFFHPSELDRPSSAPLQMLPSPPSPSNSTHIKTLYLIRHGETDANAKGIMQGRGINPPLSIKGRRQALELGKRFQETPEIELIVVSSLQVWGSWHFPLLFI
jgi:hypothetical protein